MNDEQRWADVEARLAVLEARAGGPEQPGSDEQDAFWVLRGLRQRVQDTPGGGVVFAGTVQTEAGPAEWQYGHATEELLGSDAVSRTQAAERLAALGHPVRIQLLQAVLDGHTSPTALADLEGLGTTGQVYHHIRILSTAGWLRSTRRNHVEVPAERVVPLLVALAVAR